MISSVQRLAGCKNNNCPSIDRVEDRVQVQGTTTNIDAPDGESVVEIPLDILIEAAKEVLSDNVAGSAR